MVAPSPTAKAETGPPRLADLAVESFRQAAGRSYAVALALLPWIWLGGFPLACAWILLGVAGTERLRRRCRPIPNEEWLALCRSLTDELRIRVPVQFAVCDRLAAPLLIGIVRPLVLLPASALCGYSPEQVEMVVLHELAHVRRWDNLVNLFQRLVEAVLFFHPSVWWLSRRVRLEREHCCDDVVLVHTQTPQRYAEFLAKLAFPAAVPQGAFGVSAGEQLVARIRHILHQENEPMKVSRNSVMALSAFFVALIAIAITWAHLKSPAVAAETEPVRRIPPLQSEIRTPRPLPEPRAAGARPFGMAVAQASSTPTEQARKNAAPAESRPGMRIGVSSSPGSAKTIMQPASVVAFETASLYAQINGTVEKVNVETGDRVKAGQPLIDIAAPAAKADLMVRSAKVVEAQGELEQARLALAPIQVQIQQAQKEHRDLEVLAAKARFGIAQAAIATAKARLEIAHMELQKAQSLYQTVLQAPFDGVVTRRNVSQGTAVFAASSAASQPLLVIERTDRVRVLVHVPQQYVLQVEPSCPATVALFAVPGKIYSGTVSRTAGFLDPANLEMRVEIDLSNSNGQLMSGMVGRATITLKTPPHGD